MRYHIVTNKIPGLVFPLQISLTKDKQIDPIYINFCKSIEFDYITYYEIALAT